MAPTVTFVLPVKGGSGGAHSVVQEVNALRNLGVDARVMVNDQNTEAFRNTYARFDWVQEGGMEGFAGPRSLAKLIAGADLVVATTNTSTHSIAEAAKISKAGFRTGYYVQDYEPLFYANGTAEHALAVASFAVLKSCTYFAKTSWLCDVVRTAHGHETKRVIPSIDHTIYWPRRRPSVGRRVVSAMVRPSTPRRAPRRTLRMLQRVASGEFGPVETVAFGTGAEELAVHGLALPGGVSLIGHLSQAQVAELLRESDFFLDLSDYQAFGRTAAEAMACGCIPLAPSIGGASDFILDGVNGFLTDPRSDDAISNKVRMMLSLTEAEARTIRLAGLEAVAGYTPVRAALSELRAWGFA